MTPLAQLITREWTKPVRERWDGRGGHWASPARKLINEFPGDVHCFDATDVMDAMYLLRDAHAGRFTPDQTRSFLPAPKTWIEWREPDGQRQGWLLFVVPLEKPLGIMEAGHECIVGVQAIEFEGKWLESTLRLGWSASRVGPGYVFGTDLSERTTAAQRDEFTGTMVPILNTYLVLINTPKIIGRTTHMPHAGLQRRLAKALGMVGKFPLHAWTEIKLSISPPVVDETDEPIYLTGRRALHFCRAHLRVRLGRLELVSAHWRGDPALGIKQSRYKLVA